MASYRRWCEQQAASSGRGLSSGNGLLRLAVALCVCSDGSGNETSGQAVEGHLAAVETAGVLALQAQRAWEATGDKECSYRGWARQVTITASCTCTYCARVTDSGWGPQHWQW